VSTFLTRLRRLLHRTPPARVAAHHPPPAVDLAKALHEVRASGMHGADGLDVLKLAAAGADTETWPAPRHTHRDPTTGRYTRKEQ